MFSLVKFFIKWTIIAVGVVLVVIYTHSYFENHAETISQFSKLAQDVHNIKQNITQTAQNITDTDKPCAQPITYSLGTFDTGFGLTRQEFLNDINQAVQIWDKPFNKTFFILASSSAENSDLKINLVYDYRQQATEAMNKVGVTIDDQTSVYSALKAKYSSLTSAYDQDKTTVDSLSVSFKTAQDTYNQQVDYWNSRGGAPSDQYAALNQQKAILQAQAAAITQDQNALNEVVADINADATTINQYVALLNSEANQYNSIASSTGEEFDEGEYVTDATGKRIDIFQYSTNVKLVRVLAHELGHALGLGHIPNNPQAIMYPLNQGTNLSLTSDDIAALEKICSAK